MKNKSIIITIVVAIAVGAGGFVGGMQYQKTKTPTPAGLRNINGAGPQGFGSRTARNGQNGASFTSGSIISKDDKSITVKDQNGSTKIVYFSDSTKIGKQTNGSAGDLNKDQNVTASGKSNSDGSIAADNIQIRSGN